MTPNVLAKRPFFAAMNLTDEFWEHLGKVESWVLLADLYDRHWLGRPADSPERLPRIIHQIWLGSPLPEAYRRLSDQWRAAHPGWDYRLWTDQAITDLRLRNSEAFERSPSFGVKSDIARYEILHRFGGIYIDTDFQMVKPLEPLLGLDFFAGLLYSPWPEINNGFMGARPGQPVLEAMIAATAEPVLTRDGMVVLKTTGPHKFSEVFMANGRAIETPTVIFPNRFFYPWPNRQLSPGVELGLPETWIRPETFAIHLWEASWMPQKSALRRIAGKIKRLLLRRPG